MGGHDHFWERAVSRRSVLIGGAAAGGLLAGSRALAPLAALAADDPRAKPIPGGLVVNGTGYHFNSNSFSPTDPNSFDDQITITDFIGLVGSSHTQGTGTGHDPTLGDVPLYFDADMRFMEGTYIAVDGVFRAATFGFV